MPSIIIRVRGLVLEFSPCTSTPVPREIAEPALVIDVDCTTMTEGTLRSRSDTVSAPVRWKSSSPSVVTGTPTASTPWISDPVIRTSSTGAWATCCAGGTGWASAGHAAAAAETAIPDSKQ